MSRGEGWQTVDARLATLSADEALTIAQRPRSTIVPSDVGAPSQRDLALALLRDLGVATEQRLRLERTLGEGGMGVVRLATQASMGRAVAVKTLRPGAADDLAALRLLREAWVAGQLEHPNVLPVYDVTLDEHGTPQVVMKRIDGVDLATLLADPAALRERAGGDPTAFHLRVLMQVASALHFAHDRGILHRDVKPENVMLGRFDEVYVVDWGIAVSLRDDQDPRLPRVAEATDLAGTPAYLAPEMLEGDPSRLGPWTDVYLLGAT
ncbi:MAG: serine/threonine protein kinase, partial [Deltaproteobacteria bacterium]|nr:serine/threonine protein kinase [Deltaproteobacteria bacterium]